MKVKELIAELEKLDPDRTVLYAWWDETSHRPVYEFVEVATQGVNEFDGVVVLEADYDKAVVRFVRKFGFSSMTDEQIITLFYQYNEEVWLDEIPDNAEGLYIEWLHEHGYE